MDFVYSKLVTMLTQQLQTKKKQGFQLFRFSPLSAIIKAMGIGVNKFATISRISARPDHRLSAIFVILFFFVFVCTKCLAPVGKVYILVS